MTEHEARQQLVEMLDVFTVGSVLQLLSDLHRDWAEEARRAGDAETCDRCQLAEHALVVLGLGLDAVIPSS